MVDVPHNVCPRLFGGCNLVRFLGVSPPVKGVGRGTLAETVGGRVDVWLPYLSAAHDLA